MDLNYIEDYEILYRVVRNSYPDAFVNGKPTAALFMDPGGVSVERDGGRPEEMIITVCRKRFGRREDYKTAVKITAAECRKVNTYPNPVGNHKNKFHAEIHDSEQVVEIGLLKAMQLAAMCREVEKYE
ncbi:MAG: hypothetical protein ACI4EX_01020 [Lachnospiraceae bacterium]